MRFSDFRSFARRRTILNHARKLRKRLALRVRLRRLLFECYEPRRLLAGDTRVWLDYSPQNDNVNGNVGALDAIFSEAWWGGQTRTSDGHAFGMANPGTSETDLELVRRFLDFSGDGLLSASDAYLAKRSISVDVRNLFSTFSAQSDQVLSVSVADTGSQVLAESRNNNQSNDVVVFVGTNDFRPGVRDWGASVQSPATQNYEFYAFAFAGEIANHLWTESLTLAQSGKHLHFGFVDPKDFSRQVANVVAAQASRLFGLGEVTNAPDSIMSPQRTAWLSGIVDKAYQAKLIDQANQPATTEQNGFRELANSIDPSAVPLQNTIFPANTSYPNSASTSPSNLASWVFNAGVKSAPPSTSGAVGTLTPAQIASSVRSGFSQLQQGNLLASLVSSANVISSVAPIFNGEVNSIVGFSSSGLANLLLQPGGSGYDSSGQLDFSGVTTLSDLVARLQLAGFTVESSLTDSQFSALPASSSADLIRFSRTYRRSELSGIALFDDRILDAQLETAAISASGNLNFEAEYAFHLTMGFDTGGFYLLPGKALEGFVTAHGEVNGELGSAGSSIGIASLHAIPEVSLHTTDTDGRIRTGEFDTQASTVINAKLSGAMGVDLRFQAALGSAGTARWNGGWQWDITGKAVVYRPELSGYDTDTLLDSVGRILGDGLNSLKVHLPKLLSGLEKIPVFGPDAKEFAEKMLDQQLDYADEDGLIENYFRKRGYELLVKIDPKAVMDHLLKGIAPPEDLVQVKLKPTKTDTRTLSGSGQLGLEAGTAKFDNKVSGSGTATATVSADITVGLDTRGGVYLLEGGKFSSQVTVTSTLSGTSTIPALVEGNFSTDALFNGIAVLTLNDGDTIPNEKIYLLGSQFVGILGRGEAYTLKGTVALTNSIVQAKVPRMSGLPSIKLYGSGNYDLTTGKGSYHVPDDALLDAYSQVVASGILAVRDSSLALSQITRPIPLIGDTISDAVEDVIKRAVDVRFPTTNVRSLEMKAMSLRTHSISSLITRRRRLNDIRYTFAKNSGSSRYHSIEWSRKKKGIERVLDASAARTVGSNARRKSGLS